jgi:hypothetical protein
MKAKPDLIVCSKCGNENEVSLGQTVCFRCGTELPANSLPEKPVIPASTTDKRPNSFLFAIIYAWLCFIGCFSAVLIIAMTLFQFAKTDWLQAVSKIIAMVLLIALWLPTGVSILRRMKSAIWLSYFGAAVVAIGILARGIAPLDVLLAIPTFAIVIYLKERSFMLK